MRTDLTAEKIQEVRNYKKLQEIALTLLRNRELLIAKSLKKKQKIHALAEINEKQAIRIKELEAMLQDVNHQQSYVAMEEVNEKIETLEAQIDFLNDRPTTEEYDAIKNQLEEMKGENLQLKNQLDAETTRLIELLKSLNEQYRCNDKEIQVIKTDVSAKKRILKAKIDQLNTALQQSTQNLELFRNDSFIQIEKDHAELQHLEDKLAEIEEEKTKEIAAFDTYASEHQMKMNEIPFKLSESQHQLELIRQTNEEKMSVLTREIEESENQQKEVLVQMENEKNNFEANKANLIQQFEETKIKNTETEKKLKKTIRRRKKEIEALNGQIQQMENTVNQIEEQIQNENTTFNEIQSDKESKIKELDKTTQQTHQLAKQLEDKRKELQEERDRISNELQQFKAKSDEYQKVINQIDQIHELFESKKSSLLAKIQEQQNRISQSIHNLAQKMNDSKEKFMTSLEDLPRLKSMKIIDIRQLEKKMADDLKTAEINDLTKDIADKSQQLKILQEKDAKIVAEYEEKHQKQQTEINGLQEEIQTIEDNIKFNQEKIKSESENHKLLTENLLKLKKQKSVLKDQLKSLELNSIEMTHKKSADISKMEEQIAELKKSININQFQSEERLKEINDLTNQISQSKEKHERKLNDLHEKNQNLKETLNQLNSEISQENESYHQQIQELDDEKKKLKTSLDETKKDLSELKFKNNQESTKQQLEILRLKGRQQKKESQIQNEILEHKLKISEIESEIRSNEQKIAESEKQLNQIIQSNKKKYNQTVQTNEEKSQQLKEIKDKIEQALQSYNNEIKTKSTKETELQDQIQLLRNQYESSILQYNNEISDMNHELNKKELMIESLKEKLSIEKEKHQLSRDEKAAEISAANSRYTNINKEYQELHSNYSKEIKDLKDELKRKLEKVNNLRSTLEQMRQNQKEELIAADRKLRLTENEIKILKVAIQKSRTDYQAKISELNSKQEKSNTSLKSIQKAKQEQTKLMASLSDDTIRFEETPLSVKIHEIEVNLQVATDNFHQKIDKLNQEKNKKLELLQQILDELHNLGIRENEEIQNSLNNDDFTETEKLDKKYQQREMILISRKLDCQNQIRDIDTMINAERRFFEEEKKQFLTMIEHEKYSSLATSPRSSPKIENTQTELFFDDEEEEEEEEEEIIEKKIISSPRTSQLQRRVSGRHITFSGLK